MKKIILNILFVTILKSQVGAWKSFTDMSDVRMVASKGDTVFAATSGGVFLYLKSENKFIKYLNTDGLSSNNITAVSVDEKNNLWIGHKSGKIDILNLNTSDWKFINDIYLSPKSKTGISNFYSSGDTILISTDFGVSAYNTKKFEFADTYTNFANTTFEKIITSLFYKNRFFVLTDNSLVISKQNSVNLISPDSWKVEFSNIKPINLHVFNEKIYLTTDQALFKYENETWSRIANVSVGIVSSSVSKNNLVLFYMNGCTIISTQNSATYKSFPYKDNITSSTIDSQNNYIIGSKNGIAYLTENMQSWNMKYPNGVAANSISDIVVDGKNNVWTANGLVTGKGFSKFDGSEWKNFTVNNLPNLPSNFVFNLELAPNNSLLLSTHGFGIVKINSKDEVEKVFNHTNPGFVGIANDKSYIVPIGLAIDADENLWTTIYLASNNKALWKLNKKDSSWESFNAPSTDNYTGQMNMVIDKIGTKWMGNALHGYVGIVTKFTFFNEKINVAGTNDNWGLISESNGLTGSQISGLVIDKNDEVWVATSSGITIIRELNNPMQRISKVYNGAVRDIQINVIAIDALNNKWIGTQKGIFVLSPDGNSLLKHYDVENTNGKLISNEIIAIAIDSKKGIAYFGTSNGISSLGIETIQPEFEFSDLKVKPNPFFVNKNTEIVISGLVEGSMIKIFTSSGELVKSFFAQGGGRAFWDAKDKNGKSVSSGIYYVVAYAEETNKIAQTKLAVIKK